MARDKTNRTVRRTITADPELWTERRAYVVKENLSISEYIDLLMREDKKNGRRSYKK